MRILGIDYGDARVGIAITDALNITVQGLETIQRKESDKNVLKRLDEILEQYEVEKIVVGLPLNLKGETLNINTVQACLRSLISKKYIKVADIVYSGTVLTRSYIPIVSKEEYLSTACTDILGDARSLSLIATLIDTETDISELEELEKKIKQKKKELGEK